MAHPRIGRYTLLGSLTSPYKAGFLAQDHRIFSPSHTFSVQWTHEKLLPCYSDRIAQDFHLVPSSVRSIQTDSTLYVQYGLY